MIAATILFISVAVASTIFATSSQRLFRLQSLQENVGRLMYGYFWAATRDTTYGTPKIDIKKDRETLTIEVLNGTGETTEESYEADVERLTFSDCPKCPSVIVKITLGERKE